MQMDRKSQIQGRMNSSELKRLVAVDTNKIIIPSHRCCCMGSQINLHTIASHLSFLKNNFIRERSFSPDLKDNFVGFIGMVNKSKNFKATEYPACYFQACKEIFDGCKKCIKSRFYSKRYIIFHAAVSGLSGAGPACIIDCMIIGSGVFAYVETLKRSCN